MKRFRQKLGGRRGMTLTEVLVAVLILSIVTAGVAVGVSSSVRVYRESVQFSEALTLSSSLSQAVMGELRYATDYDSDAKTFTNQSGESIKILSDNGCLVIADSTGTKLSDLISTGAYNGMRADLDYEKDGNVFQVVLTILSGGEELRSVEFAVAPLSIN